MHEIVLVNPSGAGSWQDRKDKDEYIFPYSLIYLQNYLTKFNVPSRLINCVYESANTVMDMVRRLKSPIVGVTSASYNRFEALKLAEAVKRENPRSIIVLGGKHFSFCAEDTLQNRPEVDYIVRGEGEITFLELIRSIEGSRPLDTISGISYRQNRNIYHNGDRKEEQNIDQFSLDYSTLPDASRLSKGVILRNFETEGIRSLPVTLGRGCSHNCIFCSASKMRYRVRSLESVLSEINLLKTMHHCQYFSFGDPSFTERRRFVKEFCNVLIDENVQIKWYCEARADTPLDLLGLMAQAGCVSINFALESGSRKVLKTLRKEIDPQQCVHFARECNNLNIKSLVFVMVSLPDEEESDAIQTLDVLREIAPFANYIAPSVTQILPGTELETIAKDRGVLPAGFSWSDESVCHSYSDLAPRMNPIYLEHLSIRFIRNWLQEFDQIRFAQYCTYKDLLAIARKGSKRVFKQPFSKTLKDAVRFGKGMKSKIIGHK